MIALSIMIGIYIFFRLWLRGAEMHDKALEQQLHRDEKMDNQLSHIKNQDELLAKFEKIILKQNKYIRDIRMKYEITDEWEGRDIEPPTSL